MVKKHQMNRIYTVENYGLMVFCGAGIVLYDGVILLSSVICKYLIILLVKLIYFELGCPLL